MVAQHKAGEICTAQPNSKRRKEIDDSVSLVPIALLAALVLTGAAWGKMTLVEGTK